MAKFDETALSMLECLIYAGRWGQLVRNRGLNSPGDPQLELLITDQATMEQVIVDLEQALTATKVRLSEIKELNTMRVNNDGTQTERPTLN